jgi:hypothetical protein
MKFITREKINDSLKEIFKYSKKQVFIVTPYIKLHDEVKNELKRLETKDKVHVKILFGKNSSDKVKSLPLSDLEFLKNIRNIDIRFEESLHAKFYCNEKYGILTSMNLHSYSQNNNIETGVIFKKTDRVYKESLVFFDQVFFNAEWYYSKTPTYKKIFFGLFKRYVGSQETVNFKEPTKITSISDQTGFCIRTGAKISLNHKWPYHINAYKKWVVTGNVKYEENFCHFSGKKSFGKTSFLKPILPSEWEEYYKIYKRSKFADRTE